MAGSTALFANYSARVNGLTHIALTKLDVLSAFDNIQACVAYDCDGERDHVAGARGGVCQRRAGYEELPGWKCDITACRSFDELPQEARDYVARIEELAHAEVAFVSVGLDREQTINRSWG